MIGRKRAVIDIGSNAIRFVAYGGSARAPLPLYNEKAPVSLGKSVMKHGRINDEAMGQALAALSRFNALAAMMDVEAVRIVATAAVRDASNGADLVRLAKERGIEVEMLSGDKEALAAGLGVLGDLPWAEGIVADLGGGSLELVRVAKGALGDRFSLPLGTMRIKGKNDLLETLEAALLTHPEFGAHQGQTLYLVGGAWRAMGRFEQHLTDYPLSILANFPIKPARLDNIVAESADLEALKALKLIPQPRAETLHDAARLAQALATLFRPDTLIASAQGIREGLLFDSLTPDERREDPLIACARHEGQRQARTLFNGDVLNDWITPLFAGEDAMTARLRHATCLLADSAWSIHPDYRAIHSRDYALHGNWPGINGADRMMIARALFAAHGSKGGDWPDHPLFSDDERRIDLARKWGLAIRLGMRVDGGTTQLLASSPLRVDGDKLCLRISDALACDAVARRLKSLATSLGLEARIG